MHALTQSPTTRLEKFLAHQFGPVSRDYAGDEYIKDSTDFLRQIKDLVLAENDLLFTLDVKALYPSMEQDIVMLSVDEALRNDNNLPENIKSGIAPSIEFCLKNSTLEYRGEFFRSIKGVPTGGSISRPLADAFLKYLKLFLKSRIENWDTFIILWKRFIDDIFGIWRGTKTEFEDFITNLNREASEYGIEFTGEVGTELSFLDVMVKIIPTDDKTLGIATSLYKKPTDNRSFLQRNSYHPPHVFKSVPYSQFLRARTICSETSSFNEAANEIKADLKRSGYSDLELDAALNKAKGVDRETRLNRMKSENKGNTENKASLILSTQFCREVENLRKFINTKLQTIEHIIGNEVSLTIAHRRDSNIADQLFKRRKLATTPSAVTSGTVNKDYNNTSQACHRPRCLTCKLMGGTSNGGLIVNGQLCKLDMNLDCSDCNVIYVLQCKLCNCGFYVGQTWLALSNRMNNHRAAFKPGNYQKSALALHIAEEHNVNLSDKLVNFNLGIIKKVNRDDLNMHEDIFIEKFKARIVGLNRSRVSGN